MRGKVAENNMTCLWFGMNARSCSITGVNSGLNNLSASSMTNIGHPLKSAIPFPARSKIRPGVPTKMWTVSDNLIISSLKVVPPVVTITWAPVCLPSVLHTWEVCKASSRVGTRRRAWILGTFGLTRSRVGMMKAAVLPVPFLARARISRPVSAIGIASSWIGEGFSN